MGTEIRVACTGPSAPRRAQRALAAIRRVERHLTRFDPRSELARLNADPRAEVSASSVLRDGLRSALWAARHSAGLVDPTLLDDLERAGYQTSMAGARRPGPEAGTPPHAARPAHASPAAAWMDIAVDDVAGTIARPPGVRLDLGGTGKGHAADLAARALDGAPRWLVDCGGDLRVGGTTGEQEIHVTRPGANPGDAPLAILRLADGAVATSATHARRWATGEGRVAHHLIDPSTGEPAWTGLSQVTALAGSAVAAETLAKRALLRGAQEARELLRLRGGILVHDDGAVEQVGPLPLATGGEVLR